MKFQFKYITQNMKKIKFKVNKIKKKITLSKLYPSMFYGIEFIYD
jgi:hypothetical protein